MIVSGIQSDYTGATGWHDHMITVRRRLLSTPYQTPGLTTWPEPATARGAGSANGDNGVLQPSGNRKPPTAGTMLTLGQTGITIDISDLKIPASDTRAILDGKTYRLPMLTRAGHADIQAGDTDTTIKINQDRHGNTIITGNSNGAKSEVNLGRIAALNITGGNGHDRMEINLNNFYGGITADGAAGDDTIAVNAARVMNTGLTVRGGEGADTITLSGQAIKTLVDGQAGNDLIDARNLTGGMRINRALIGGDGHDIIYGADNDNTIYGGNGNDLIYGGRGDDRLHGGAGDDTIHGISGKNIIHGGAGDDVLHGGNDDDVIIGADGNDTLIGGGGFNTLDGGEDDDRLYYSGRGILRGGGGVNTFAPEIRKTEDAYPTGRTADYLEIMTRRGVRRQAIITEPQSSARALTDYDHTTDYFIERQD